MFLSLLTIIKLREVTSATYQDLFLGNSMDYHTAVDDLTTEQFKEDFLFSDEQCSPSINDMETSALENFEQNTIDELEIPVLGDFKNITPVKLENLTSEMSFFSTTSGDYLQILYVDSSIEKSVFLLLKN